MKRKACSPPAAGVALIAVLVALTLLLLLALPFTIGMSIGYDAAVHGADERTAALASASVRDQLLADASLGHPLLDLIPPVATLRAGMDAELGWNAGERLLLIALAPHRRDLAAQVQHLVRQLALHLLQLADVLLEDRRVVGVERPIHQPVQVGGDQGLNFAQKGSHSDLR